LVGPRTSIERKHPAVPIDVVDKVCEGVEEGIEKLTEPDHRKR